MDKVNCHIWEEENHSQESTVWCGFSEERDSVNCNFQLVGIASQTI